MSSLSRFVAMLAMLAGLGRTELRRAATAAGVLGPEQPAVLQHADAGL